MDRLKRQANWCRFVKQRFKESVQTSDGRWRMFGPVHVKSEDYGKDFGGLVPYTNRYVKAVKRELKIEYRAAKRGEKQEVRKEIERILLEENETAV
jgi:hypothetical protein